MMGLCLSACSTNINNSENGGSGNENVPPSENGYKTIEECTNEFACYNTMLYAKRMKAEKYSNLSEEERNSLSLISGHGDLITNKGSGTIYISYSFMNGGNKVVCNESFTLSDYGILNNRYLYNTVSFRSDESSCDNGEKGTSMYIDVKRVNYYFGKYQNSELPVKKKVMEFNYYNWDDSFISKETIEGYGTRITGPEATKEGDKQFYYTLQSWRNTDGDYFDMIARESLNLKAYYKQEYVKYTVSIKNYDGSVLTSFQGNYHQELSINLNDIPLTVGDKNRYIYTSTELRPVEGDTWYLFNGFEEEETYVDSIRKGYSNISGSREDRLYATYNLKPIEDSFSLTAKYLSQSVYDNTALGDGTYRIDLYKNLLYEESLYGGNERTVTIPSKAFTYDSNGTKQILGDVSEIGEFCYSTRESINDPYGTYDNSKVVHLNLPASLRTIKKCAFYYCNALSEIILNKGLVEIEQYAFASTGVRTVYIPKSLTTIGRNAFSQRYSNSTQIKVFYEGSADDWSKINIDSSNELLSGAEFVYNATY